MAHGDHVADVVPAGELDRLRESIGVLSDSELGARATRRTGRYPCRARVSQRNRSPMTWPPAAQPSERNAAHSQITVTMQAYNEVPSTAPE